jgi:hypothetical protein
VETAAGPIPLVRIVVLSPEFDLLDSLNHITLNLQ